jgi:hypothetical protein
LFIVVDEFIVVSGLQQDAVGVLMLGEYELVQ